MIPIGNPKPVVGIGLPDTKVRGETVLVRRLSGVASHIGYLVALGAHDGVLCCLYGCGDDIRHYYDEKAEMWSLKGFETGIVS